MHEKNCLWREHSLENHVFPDQSIVKGCLDVNCLADLRLSEDKEFLVEGKKGGLWAYKNVKSKQTDKHTHKPPRSPVVPD